jgi:hypothetical protein
MILLRFFGQQIKIMNFNNLVYKKRNPSDLVNLAGFLKKMVYKFIRILDILKCLFWLPDRLLPKQSLTLKPIKKLMQC